MAAGLATLQELEKGDFYQDLAATTKRIADGLATRAKAFNVPLLVNHVGGMFGLFFTDQPTVDSFDAVSRCDLERFKRFFHGMLAQGVYLAPSAYEACFVSAAHAQSEIKQTLIAAEQVFSQL
jgi:glutamate-1-semialdehyde 2,1-aminomutase